MMKKHIFKLTAATLALVMSMALVIPALAEETTGGDVKEEEPEYRAIDLLGTDLSPYISLGKYKDFDITVNVAMTDAELYEMAVKNNVYTEVKSRDTKAGDTLGVSYVGKLATSTGKLIPVRGGTGSGTLTQGKAEGKSVILDLIGASDALIGVTPDKTVDIKVKLPEDYSEKAMAGREVTFAVTVKAIIEYGYTEEYVKSKYGCESLDEYKLLLTKESLKNFEQLVAYEIYLNIVKEATVIKYPTEHYQYYYDAQYSYYKKYYESNAQYAEYYGSFENFLQANGISLKDIEEYAKLQTERDLVCFAVYKTGAVGTISDTEYEIRLTELASESGKTVAQLEAMYAGKHDLSNIIIGDYTYEKLGRLASLTTDYDEYKYLLDVVETTGGVTTEAPNGDAGEGIDPNVIVMIVLIAVGAVGIIVIFAVQTGTKKKKLGEDELDDDEEYEDGEPDGDGEIEENEENDEEAEDEE